MPPKRQAAAVLARRRRLMVEIAALQRANAAKFAAKAEELLTRWWSSANWLARRELLKTAEWLIRLEKRRASGEQLRA